MSDPKPKRALLWWWAFYELYGGETNNGESKGNTSDAGITRTVTAAGITRTVTAQDVNKYCTEAMYPYDPGLHWCGIFQTYLLRRAGVKCHWDSQKGIIDDEGKDLDIVIGPKAQRDLAMGDIVHVSKRIIDKKKRVEYNYSHYFMVLEPAQTGFLKNIEGNAGGPKNPMLASNWKVEPNVLGNIVEAIDMRYRVVS